MKMLERRVQQLNPALAESYKAWEQKWAELEARLGGFPPKRHYSLWSGADLSGTMVWEREWESFAVMEREYTRMFGDPESQKLTGQPGPVASERIEYYFAAD
jgi:hypothetical protein